MLSCYKISYPEWYSENLTLPSIACTGQKTVNKIFQLISFLLKLNDFSTCISQPLQGKIRKHLKEHKVNEKAVAFSHCK